MKAQEVLDALEAKFGAKHLTFREVKNGPSWGLACGLRRLDFLAIARTWSPITITACEVKVSRSDFTGDQKWPAYLKLCNRFYWACPHGLIKLSEIDPRCGLITVNPITKKARSVRAAPFRDVGPDPLMLLYLLFWREPQAPDTTVGRIRQDMQERREVGERYRHFVSNQLNRAEERVREIRRMASVQGAAAKELVAFTARHKLQSGWAVRSLLEDAHKLHGIGSAIGEIEKAARKLLDIIDKNEPMVKGEK